MAARLNQVRGFTLIELLVVISIIAILSVIGTVVFTNVQTSARDSRRKADIDAIVKSFEVKYNNTGSYGDLTPETNGGLFSSGVFPKDPSGEDYTIIQNADTKGFRVCATLEENPQDICFFPSSDCSCKSSLQAEPPPAKGGDSGSTFQPVTNESGIPLFCPAEGLISHWVMDETSGTSVADNADGLSGTWSGSGSHWTEGKINGAGSFNGSNDYVAFSGWPPIGADFTVSFWVYPTRDGNANFRIIGGQQYLGGSQFMFTYRNTSVFFLIANTAGNAGVHIAVPAPTNTWTHIAGTFDGTTGKLYKNGTLAASGNFSGIFNTRPGEPFVMGRADCSAGCWYFGGRIDDTRIYNRTLFPEDTNKLYGNNAGCS